MKRALVATLLLSFGAFAAEPVKDAPLAIVMAKGTVLPDDLAVMTPQQAIDVANRIKNAEDDAASKFGLPVILIAAAICLGGGVAIGFAVGSRTAPK